MAIDNQLTLARAWLVNATDFKKATGPCHCGSCACKPCKIAWQILRVAGVSYLEIAGGRIACKPHATKVAKAKKRKRSRKPRKSK